MKETGKKMSELSSLFQEVPQVLINCRVRRRADLNELKGYKELILAKEKELGTEADLYSFFWNRASYSSPC